MATSTKKLRRSAAECIAFHFGWDIEDVKEIQIRAGRTTYPVYSDGPEVYCCPPMDRKPPQDRDQPYEWHQVGEVYGRAVYCSGGQAEKLSACFKERRTA
jgi:hypothetical protein